MDNSEYLSKVNKEKEIFDEKEVVHDLPDSFHYWSNKYLKPRLENLGISDIPALFADPIAKLYNQKGHIVTVASLGAGNCDFEIAVMKRLLKQGISVEMHCYELNHIMLDRGKDIAKNEGISDHIRFIQSDINKIKINQEYDVFMANQSLHHFVNLEHIFESVCSQMKPDGYFIISDMIGRNGHMRWPEANEIVCKLWSLLEKEKKWNHQLKRYEEVFDNWDCSKDGFEGIRSQDILPLLMKYFKFELFYAFSNVIYVFIDRSFGHNFDPRDPFDRAFIDFVAQLDEKCIKEGKITPTHLIARMVLEEPREIQVLDNLTPEKCLRPTSHIESDSERTSRKNTIFRLFRELCGRINNAR